MKKAGLFSVFFICLFPAPGAYAEEKIEVSSDFDGYSAYIKINTKGSSLIKKFNLSADGKVTSASLFYSEGGADVQYFIYFANGKSDAFLYYYGDRDNNTVFRSYDRRKNNNAVFVAIDKFVAAAAAKHNFAKLAKEATSCAREAYMKERDEKKKREEERAKAAPTPDALLKKLIK